MKIICIDMTFFFFARLERTAKIEQGQQKHFTHTHIQTSSQCTTNPITTKYAHDREGAWEVVVTFLMTICSKYSAKQYSPDSKSLQRRQSYIKGIILI